jgi:hypothetical protein
MHLGGDIRKVIVLSPKHFSQKKSDIFRKITALLVIAVAVGNGVFTVYAFQGYGAGKRMASAPVRHPACTQSREV